MDQDSLPGTAQDDVAMEIEERVMQRDAQDLENEVAVFADVPAEKMEMLPVPEGLHQAQARPRRARRLPLSTASA